MNNNKKNLPKSTHSENTYFREKTNAYFLRKALLWLPPGVNLRNYLLEIRLRSCGGKYFVTARRHGSNLQWLNIYSYNLV